MRRDCAATSITNRALALVGQIAASEMTLGNLDPDQSTLGGVGKIPGPPDVDIGNIALRVFSRLADDRPRLHAETLTTGPASATAG